MRAEYEKIAGYYDSLTRAELILAKDAELFNASKALRNKPKIAAPSGTGATSRIGRGA
jgi:hypothetical protein